MHRLHPAASAERWLIEWLLLILFALAFTRLFCGTRSWVRWSSHSCMAKVRRRRCSCRWPDFGDDPMRGRGQARSGPSSARINFRSSLTFLRSTVDRDDHPRSSLTMPCHGPRVYIFTVPNAVKVMQSSYFPVSFTNGLLVKP